MVIIDKSWTKLQAKQINFGHFYFQADLKGHFEEKKQSQPLSRTLIIFFSLNAKSFSSRNSNGMFKTA